MLSAKVSQERFLNQLVFTFVLREDITVCLVSFFLDTFLLDTFLLNFLKVAVCCIFTTFLFWLLCSLISRSFDWFITFFLVCLASSTYVPCFLLVSCFIDFFCLLAFFFASLLIYVWLFIYFLLLLFQCILVVCCLLLLIIN